MKRSARLGLGLGLAVLISAAPARAILCAADAVPAATLLLPYFEVDLDDPFGRTTLLSVVNNSPQSHIVKVSLWTDLGVVTLDFDLYLTGWDVVTMNLRDVFLTGDLPITAAGQFPVGELSEPHNNPGECVNVLPYSPGVVRESLRTHLREAHTGGPSPIFNNKCSGRDLGDRVARGFVTLDVMTRCTFTFPTDPGHFGPLSAVGYDNVLSGDFLLIDSRLGQAFGESLVGIEASNVSLPNSRTFYSALGIEGGLDRREPLPSRWGARFFQGAPNFSTDLLIWKNLAEPVVPFPCGTPPASLLQRTTRQAIAFDENERAESLLIDVVVDPPPPTLEPLRAVSQRVRLNEGELVVPHEFGWLRFDFSHQEPGQAWVITNLKASSNLSVSTRGTPYDEPCEVPNP